MLRKILIANRGEIAVRIIRTARRLGVGTVAVVSEADRRAPFARMADEVVEIGPGPATESYLRGDRIIAAAKQTGAKGIHPGYGFLAENADFAEAVGKAGLKFIGPSPEAMRRMGGKAEAKAIAVKAFRDVGQWTADDEAYNSGLLKRQGVLADAWAGYLKTNPPDDKQQFQTGWMDARKAALVAAGLEPIF